MLCSTQTLEPLFLGFSLRTYSYHYSSSSWAKAMHFHNCRRSGMGQISSCFGIEHDSPMPCLNRSFTVQSFGSHWPCFYEWSRSSPYSSYRGRLLSVRVEGVGCRQRFLTLQDGIEAIFGTWSIPEYSINLTKSCSLRQEKNIHSSLLVLMNLYRWGYTFPRWISIAIMKYLEKNISFSTIILPHPSPPRCQPIALVPLCRRRLSPNSSSTWLYLSTRFCRTLSTVSVL